MLGARRPVRAQTLGSGAALLRVGVGAGHQREPFEVQARTLPDRALDRGARLVLSAEAVQVEAEHDARRRVASCLRKEGFELDNGLRVATLEAQREAAVPGVGERHASRGRELLGAIEVPVRLREAPELAEGPAQAPVTL